MICLNCEKDIKIISSDAFLCDECYQGLKIKYHNQRELRSAINRIFIKYDGGYKNG